MIQTHIVHLTSDNTDALSGTIMEDIPSWARFFDLQIVSSDYDMLFDLDILGREAARQSAAHVFGAANAGSPDWTKPHVSVNIGGDRQKRPIVNINIVTGGEVLVVSAYRDR